MYQQDQLKSYVHRYYRSCQNRNFMKTGAQKKAEQEKIVRLHNTVTVPDNVLELKCKCEISAEIFVFQTFSRKCKKKFRFRKIFAKIYILQTFYVLAVLSKVS